MTYLSRMFLAPMRGVAGVAVCDFLLLAPFDGAADQGYADAQVLDTEAEGVAVDELTVVEVTGTVQLLSNYLRMTGANSTTNTGVYNATGHAKALGRSFLWKIKSIGGTYIFWGGLHTAAALVFATNMEYAFSFRDTAVIRKEGNVRTALQTVGAYAGDIEYDCALVLGGYDANEQPWYSGAVGTFLHGASMFIKGGAFTDWTLLWRFALGNNTPLYPVHGVYTNAQSVDRSYLRVPDNDYSAVLQPTAADWFVDPNGTSLDAHTPDVTPGGGWTERVGNWQITGNEAVVAAQTDRACATMEAGVSDVWGRDSLESNTADSTTAGDSGLVYRWVGNDNYWYAGINDAANVFRVVERNGGVETVRATVGVAIATGTQYEVTFQVSGNVHQAWLNGGNRLTHTSASHNTATACGIRSKETTDAHDNFHVQPASGYAGLDDCPGYAVTPPSPTAYMTRVLNTTPIAYWPQSEASGSVASCWVNAAQDGTYTGVTLGESGIGDGSTSPLYDGANDYTNIYSASLAGVFDGDEGSVLIWARVANAGVWTDGVSRYLLNLRADGQNTININKRTANNELQFLYRAGNVTETVQHTYSNTAFFSAGLTWSKSADEVRAYINGSPVGGIQSGLGVWAGALSATETVIGAFATTPSAVWHGYLAHAAVWDRALTPAEVLSLGVL